MHRSRPRFLWIVLLAEYIFVGRLPRPLEVKKEDVLSYGIGCQSQFQSLYAKIRMLDDSAVGSVHHKPTSHNHYLVRIVSLARSCEYGHICRAPLEE